MRVCMGVRVMYVREMRERVCTCVCLGFCFAGCRRETSKYWSTARGQKRKHKQNTPETEKEKDTSLTHSQRTAHRTHNKHEHTLLSLSVSLRLPPSLSRKHPPTHQPTHPHTHSPTTPHSKLEVFTSVWLASDDCGQLGFVLTCFLQVSNSIFSGFHEHNYMPRNNENNN